MLVQLFASQMEKFVLQRVKLFRRGCYQLQLLIVQKTVKNQNQKHLLVWLKFQKLEHYSHQMLRYLKIQNQELWWNQRASNQMLGCWKHHQIRMLMLSQMLESLWSQMLELLWYQRPA